MGSNDAGSRGEGTARRTNETVGRRRYLQLAGALVGTGALVGRARAKRARHGIKFDEVIDMGETDADPTGEEPSDTALETAAGPNTLLVFPPGAYLIEDRHAFSGLGNFGFYGEGQRHGVSFVAPDGLRANWFTVYDMDAFVWENVDWDATGENQLGNLAFTVRNRLHVEDMELLGDTTANITLEEIKDPDLSFLESNQGKMMKPYVQNPDGQGLIKNVVAKTGGGLSGIPKYYIDDDGARYKQGKRGAFFSGPSHEGTLTFKDCHIEEFGSHGIYASAAAGPIHVEGGVWRNNDSTQIRIGGEDSYIKNATIEVDTDAIPESSPTVVNGGYRGLHGVFWQPKKRATFGGTVKNCDINMLSSPAEVIDLYGNPAEPKSRAGVLMFETDPAENPTPFSLTVENAHFRIVDDNMQAVRGREPRLSDPDDYPTGLHLKNAHVTGDAAGREVIEMNGRDDTLIENSRIVQPGADRDGLLLRESDTTVRNTTIDVTGDPFVLEDSDLETKNVRT